MNTKLFRLRYDLSAASLLRLPLLATLVTVMPALLPMQTKEAELEEGRRQTAVAEVEMRALAMRKCLLWIQTLRQ